MSTKTRKEKRRPKQAIDFTQLDKWYGEVLFVLDGKQYTRQTFAKMRVINTGAISRLKNYIKRNKITSVQELWDTDWFDVGGDRTRYVAMRVLEQSYQNVDDWLDYNSDGR